MELLVVYMRLEFAGGVLVGICFWASLVYGFRGFIRGVGVDREGKRFKV